MRHHIRPPHPQIGGAGGNVCGIDQRRERGIDGVERRQSGSGSGGGWQIGMSGSGGAGVVINKVLDVFKGEAGDCPGVSGRTKVFSDRRDRSWSITTTDT